MQNFHYFNLVRKLLLNGVDPNQGDDDGLTALHQSCIDDFEDVVRLGASFSFALAGVKLMLWFTPRVPFFIFKRSQTTHRKRCRCQRERH